MAAPPKGYRDIPEADQKKAQIFFERGRTVAETGNYEYAIDMFLEGLKIDPDSKEAHQQLRDISLMRKASGGKALGMMANFKLRAGKDDKENMLNAERALAYDPGNTSTMVSLMLSALKAGFYDTVLWIGPILFRANADSKSPERSKYLTLKDTYKELRQWKLATEACQLALQMDPLNMELQSEMKNLGAQNTMDEGHYLEGGSFRESMKGKDDQDRLIQEGRDVKSLDLITRQILEAEEAYKVDQNEGKLLRLVEFLEKTEDVEHENRALELLEEGYERTKQFRFRQRVGKIKIQQMKRMERTLRDVFTRQPENEQAKLEHEQYKRELLEYEMQEFQLWAENYPTDLQLKFEVAARLFALQRYEEAIPMFQQSRSDPKLKVDAAIALGRAFLEAQYLEEAIQTLQEVVDDYQLKGDERSRLMNYWQGRAFEQIENKEMALKRYSQVAQWEFTYKDVQQRIRKLRGGGGPGAPGGSRTT